MIIVIGITNTKPKEEVQMLKESAKEIEELHEAIAKLSEEDQAILDELIQEINVEITERGYRYPFEIIFAAYSKSFLWLAEMAEVYKDE